MAAKTIQAHSTSALLALSLLLAGATSTAGGLRFDAQGGFQLLQLTDMHFGENAAKDARTVKVCSPGSEGSPAVRVCGRRGGRRHGRGL